MDSVLLIRANVITPSSDTFCLLRELIERTTGIVIVIVIVIRISISTAASIGGNQNKFWSDYILIVKIDSFILKNASNIVIVICCLVCSCRRRSSSCLLCCC